MYKANSSQLFGAFLLVFVMFLAPALIVLAKNGISSIQVRRQQIIFILQYRQLFKIPFVSLNKIDLKLAPASLVTLKSNFLPRIKKNTF